MNPYETLGIPYGSSREEVRKAFLKLAHQHHPDKGGDADIFKKVSAAYAELRDKPDDAYQPPPRQPNRQWDVTFHNVDWAGIVNEATKTAFETEAQRQAFVNNFMQQHNDLQKQQQQRHEEFVKRMMGNWFNQ